MAQKDKQVSKYLAQYAEPEMDLLGNFPSSQSYNHVVVIPAYQESFTFIENFLCSTLADENALVILVVNQPQNDDNLAPQQTLNTAVKGLGDCIWSNQNLSLIQPKAKQTQVLLVDRFNQPIPEDYGVGLARKIGCDLAVYLIHHDIVKTAWVHSTDADAQLPSNYFSAVELLSNKETVAACYNFTHHSENEEIHQATQAYESALKYYVDGLKFANSPYAFFTIGSTIVFEASAYTKVRGFPKKSAGEDFYLLNKLAKLGKVAFIEEAKIILKARLSDRVPFGTGPAVSKILSLQSEQKDYTYYHPKAFECLKQTLTAFESLWCECNKKNDWQNSLTEESLEALKSIGFERFVEKHHTDNEKQFNKQLIVWFDGFKTLKFIHALRDNGLQNLPLNEIFKIKTF